MNKLRKILCMAAVAASVVLAACGSDKPLVTVEIAGLGDRTVIVTYSSVWDQGDAGHETLQAMNGAFTFDKQLSGLTELLIFPEDLSLKSVTGQGGVVPEASSIQLYLMPDEKIVITGELKEDNTLAYRVKGSQFNDDMAVIYGGLLENSAEMDQINFEKLMLMGDNSEEGLATKNELEAEYTKLNAERIKVFKEYIESNPDKEASTLLVMLLPVEISQKYYDMLDDMVKKSSRMSLVMEAQFSYLDEMERMVQKIGEVERGKPAPDFTLETPGGSKLSLDDISGKYVVLDFWGSWCPPCISGFPKMKEYYAKYRDKVEFVGIACGDTKEDWLNALIAHGPTWKQVKADDANTISITYGIRAYPTKMILGKNHEILDIFVGETDDFYKRLDELLK